MPLTALRPVMVVAVSGFGDDTVTTHGRDGYGGSCYAPNGYARPRESFPRPPLRILRTPPGRSR
jgi:hypothetical protein